MKKVDVPQIRISSAAIFGIGLLWYDFNVKIFHTVRDLLRATLFEKDEEGDKIRDILAAAYYGEDGEDDEDEEEKTD